MSDKFFIPNLIYYLHPYIKGCHICQLACNKKHPTRQFQTRINLSYRPLSRLSMDLKVILRTHKGHKYILCIIDEVTNYLITVLILICPDLLIIATVFFNRLSRGMLLRFRTPTILCINDESNYTALINRLPHVSTDLEM